MALSNDELTKIAAAFKGPAKKRFDTALAALLSLAWEYKYMGDTFRFDVSPDLYDRALAICREMSDGCLEDSEKLVRTIFDEEIEMDNTAAEIAQESFDMAGSHLIELVTAWAIVAFENGFTESYTRISIVRYMNNPFASGMFGAWGKDVLKWGRGYDRNIFSQMTVIGQNLIIDAARSEEWRQMLSGGATYYIRRRGSNFDCPTCDETCGFPIPISEPFERTHSRCVCWPEYHYEPMPL